MRDKIASPPQSLRDSSPLKGERAVLLGRAQQLRQNATEEEKRLWQYLRKLAKFRFRRQVLIGRFIVDFCCHKTKTVIELDGAQHADSAHRQKDRNRDAWLEKEGYLVLRFWNPVSEDEWDGLIDAICAATRSPLRGELAAKPSEGGDASMKSNPNLYDYWPYAGRPKITWPGGKKLAFWIAPNIEFYEFMPPNNPQRQPWPNAIPNVQQYSPA